jgi:hypothetical protein
MDNSARDYPTTLAAVQFHGIKVLFSTECVLEFGEMVKAWQGTPTPEGGQ